MFFFWASVIMMEGFLVAYLTGIGYGERQIGLVMASLFFPSVVTTPLWGYLADRTSRHRAIIIGCLVVSIAAVQGIWASGRIIGLAITFGFLYSLTLMSMPGLVDSWVMSLRRRGFTISYEIARAFGSLGYSACGAILGFVLERLGLNLVFPIYAAVMVITVVLVVTMRDQGLTHHRLASDTSAEPETSSTGSNRLESPVTAVLTNRRYLILVVSAFLAFVGMRASMTFLPLRIFELGGNTAHVGLAQSVFAGSEIPFMFLSVLALRRFKPRIVLSGALFFYVIRLVVVRFMPTAPLLVAVQLLQGPSTGFMLPAAVHYIDRIAPPPHRTLFQTLAPAIYFGLASVVGSAVGGVLVDSRGLDALYTAAPVVAASGAILFAVALVVNRRSRVSSSVSGSSP